jgi:hypothetical protein
MNNETLNINKENVLNAYGSATDEQKAMLEIIFGKDTFKSKDITERIKTFEDACKELGSDHPLVLAYQNTNLRDAEVANDNKDIIAYMKLRIIVAALNEGWEPQFIPGEYRWFPYFVLYTKDEIDEMDEKTRARVVYRSSNSASASGGVSFAYSNSDSASVDAYVGSRLAFKTDDLAEYAGKQFIEIYADFMLGWELKK